MSRGLSFCFSVLFHYVIYCTDIQYILCCWSSSTIISVLELPCLEELDLSIINGVGMEEDASSEVRNSFNHSQSFHMFASFRIGTFQFCRRTKLSHVSPKLSHVWVKAHYPAYSPLRDRDFKEALPGLSSFLSGKCSSLKSFRIEYGSMCLGMFVADRPPLTGSGWL